MATTSSTKPTTFHSHDQGASVNYFTYKKPFILESGKVLNEITIAYTAYGDFSLLNHKVVWICHAYTANADPVDWWPGMVGEGKYYDPAKHFIVCANILGSCYGSTGPLSTNPETKEPYFRSFPDLSVRDQIRAHGLLREHLGITRIHTIIGASIGGHQALEWTIAEPELFTHAVFIATNAGHSAWVTAFNETQRMCILADLSYEEDKEEGGLNGMKAARAMALISYRNRNAYLLSQSESDGDKLSDFKVSSYQRYQGEKLAKRFNAYSYVLLSKTMDTHNVGRKRGGIANALSQIKAKTLVISISSDQLFPPEEQALIAEHIHDSHLVSIHSDFGHDGFLLEDEQLSTHLNNFYNPKTE